MTLPLQRVLIVGGTQCDRENCKQYLNNNKQQNYDIILTDSGHEGVALSRTLKPDCILLDFCLFDFDGFEFIDIIVENHIEKAIPIIVLIDSSQNYFQNSPLQKGISTFLIRDQLSSELLAMTIKNAITKATIEDRLCNEKMIFQQLIKRYLARSRRYCRRNALLIAEIDHYKELEKKLSLNEMANFISSLKDRLYNGLRRNDVINQIEHNQFAILIEEISDHFEVGMIVRRILQNMVPSHLQITPKINMGISIYPDDCVTPQSLLNNAKTALHICKENPNINYYFYNEQMHADDNRRYQIELDLRHAFYENEFYLNYQPIYDLATKTPFAHEALIRWKHPKLDIIGPREFIPVAEKAGLMIPIGEWILQHACHDYEYWLELSGSDNHYLYLKISAHQLYDYDLFQSLLKIIEQSNLPCKNIVLEITEETIHKSPKQVQIMLRNFKDIGIKLCISDFGQSYSSINYLKKAPVDILKMDPSFVKHCLHNKHDTIAIKCILDLGHNTGMQVICPGIETQTQLQFLIDHGARLGQGYYLSTPLPVDEVTNYFRENQNKNENSQ